MSRNQDICLFEGGICIKTMGNTYIMEHTYIIQQNEVASGLKTWQLAGCEH